MKKFQIIALIFFLCNFSVTSSQPPQLRNFGASCYVNALIQSLYAAQPLTQTILDLKFENRPARKYKKLVKAFMRGEQQAIDAKLFDFYFNVKDMFVDAQSVKKTIATSRQKKQKPSPLVVDIARAKNENFDKLPPQEKQILINSIEDVLAIFNRNPQQDAHEFLTKLIDKLRGDDKVSDTFHAIENIFFNRTLNNAMESIINVPAYNSKKLIVDFAINAKGQIEIFDPIHEYTNLYEGLNAYFEGNHILKLPKTLILSLNRFIIGNNIETQEKRSLKIFHPIKIPFTLEMDKFILEKDNILYDLFAVVVHRGTTATSGHYVAYVKSDNQWYLCNDMDVNKVTNKTVHTEINKDGYILFYEPAQGSIKSPLFIIKRQLKKLRNKLRELYKSLT
jgi:ubiquitin C-terminal hydrolase